MHRTSARTPFGERVARYAFERGVPLTVVAKECGVSYETLRSAMCGRTAGKAIIPIVEEHIDRREAGGSK